LCNLVGYNPAIEPLIQTEVAMVGNVLPSVSFDNGAWETSGNVDFCSSTTLTFLSQMIVYNYPMG
jgi:hypothetical protein